MLVVGIIQTIASVILSLVGIMVAYLIYKVQRDRNTPKLVLVTGELLEDDEHEEECYAIRILNVGLVPAVNVSFLVDIEEWQDGREIRSKFHENGVFCILGYDTASGFSGIPAIRTTNS